MSANNSDWSRKRGREGDDKGKSPGDRSEGKSSPHPGGSATSAVRTDSAKKEPSGPSPGSQQQQRQSSSSAPHQPLPPPHSASRHPASYPAYPAPPQASGEHGVGFPPPPRGYENGPPPGYPGGPPHPYPMPPGYHYMPPPYAMYPPPPYYQPHPMYGPPPPHQQPPHYPYPPHHDPNMPRYPDAGGHEGYPPPYGSGPPGPGGHPPRSTQGSGQHHEGDRKPSASRASADSSRTEGSDDDLDDDEIGAGASSARLRTYIKPRIPSTQEVLDRRARKNAQSRARAAKLRLRIAEIELKPEDERNEEEVHLWAQYEQRRQRKNNRSRERALEKKEEIDRIVSKTDKKRSKIEKQFLETALSAKKRKNEGDRLRRQRLKELGLSTKGTGVKPGISARGPLPPQYQQLSQQNFGPMMHPSGHHGMGDIPMSPLPAHHPHHLQSPGFGSPGMMQSLNFPSPSNARHGGTPGRHHGSMPYMPPPHAYDPQVPSPSRGQSHHYHDSNAPGSQVVEQRRHADGSISFSIDGRGPTGGSAGRDARSGAGGGEQQGNETDLLMDSDGYGEIADSNVSNEERDMKTDE